MKRGRMFLAQRRMNEVILYCVLADVVLAYLLKRFQGPHTVFPLALLYLLNILVILAVYRFWKFPVFEWDGEGFFIYGVNPFKKERCLWPKVEKAGFKTLEAKKGRVREFFMVDYVTQKGARKTGVIPLDMIGFGDRVKKELLELLKDRRIKGY
ncbi:MAG TPA: hypothetical protein VJM83_00380 [Nitrospirota bacterium]|nr:hypothetical protein [Nitrospirota bacterium]